MINLIIFDLDGVLVDSKEIHYEALNRALKEVGDKYVITRDEHLTIFDGLSTRKKLDLLTERKGLPTEKHSQIWKAKQDLTAKIISTEIGPDQEKIALLRDLSEKGFKLVVASNAIRQTVKMMLLQKGLLPYIDFYLSNEDVINPKPHPEMYMTSMLRAGCSPKETLIIEDSHVGRRAAWESGAHLCGVKDPEEVTVNKIMSSIDLVQRKGGFENKWQGGDLKVLIPMAGAGSRFQEAGYTFPKPLIEVNGKPMIQLVVDNLNIDAQHIFIVQKSHYEQYNLKHLLNLISPGCEIIQVEGITEGAACTTLLAKEFINDDKPLLMANSDQYIEWDSSEFMYSMTTDNIDGGILTFNATHPKWSFAKINEETGLVTEVAEKKPISNLATVGVYYWRQGKDYVKYAEQMIEQNRRVNNEFYVCPVFNEAIGDNKRIKTFNINKMWGIGDPQSLQTYLEHHKY